ncbi:peptidoglycan-binding protein [Streptomyces sp. NPDC091281]|uniref:peptidoglycan-binding domain-containing protein n=1 Tax=Streptomyces sp. NPDC091281 TaxID=3365985 RepID=UPI003823B989
MPAPARPGPEDGTGGGGPVLEPVRVLRPRNTDALAELFRELTEDGGPYEAVEPLAETPTEEIPPVPAAVPPPGRRAERRAGRRRAGPRGALVAAGVVLTAALAGFGAALLLDGGDGDPATARIPPATAPVPDPPPAAADDPDGPGTLREGATGPEVTDLQQRLRRVPDVYADGATDGRYDTLLTEAVARFQLWYGVRGDESGVYGDDTRRDLEART